ncbi:ionotropic receptor 75a-like isoform X2 [Harmonia axyridis]|uniref:ionotropic receptor 75a-like isoform X2 n=1 Tax=Harmonia axyridis TaxID=115357 RepID=UPI001E2750AA|nr:ionotropic receptor 75a-like isoform X2 [Harmonia axyridis]
MRYLVNILLVQDKWFGNEVAGLEDGVAKHLHEEISDLSSVVGLIKKDRVKFFDFVNPMYRFGTSFMFRNRGTHDLWENEFLKPFTTKVWLSIVVVLTLLSVFLKITNWIETILMKANGSYSFFTAILITVSVICQQGSYITPSRLTSRFLFFMILILSFLLYNYYTSSIVSALLNAKPREPTSYKDLIRSGLELGIQMAPYTFTIFETNMNPDIQAIRKLVFPDRGKPHVWNVTDGIEKIRTGPYAYHMESSIGYFLIAKTFDAGAICELSDKIALIPASYLSFYLKKDSQYKNLLKISLRKMEETGLVHRYRLIWEEKKPPCFSNAILLSVGLDQTFIAFFVLFVGLAISVTLLVFERWYYHHRKSPMERAIPKPSFD